MHSPRQSDACMATATTPHPGCWDVQYPLQGKPSHNQRIFCISISAPVCPVRASAYPPRQPQIYITVSDWNKMSKADVVGHASISAQQLHHLLIKEPAEISSHSATAGPAEEVELTLVDTHGKPVGDRVFAGWGDLPMMRVGPACVVACARLCRCVCALRRAYILVACLCVGMYMFVYTSSIYLYTHDVYMCIHVCEERARETDREGRFYTYVYMHAHTITMCLCAGDGEKQESDGAQGNASRYSESRTLGRSGSLCCLPV